MVKKRFALSLIVLITTLGSVVAQEVDLFKNLEEQSKKDQLNQTDYTKSIFKTTRLVNGHSIENVGAGILDVKISHRFGAINNGAYGLWGLDQALIRIGADYGITSWLMVGAGRSSENKTFDAFTKARLLRQSTGKRKMPISLSYLGSTSLKTIKSDDFNNYPDRMVFTNQLLFAKKFNDYFSLQLVPTLVHYNSVAKSSSPNDYYSLGIGDRIRLTKRVNLTTEYYYRFTKIDGSVNSLSIGFDIETGGHVFQFHFSNSTGMTEGTFINETTDKWDEQGMHLGFNIARVFALVKPKSLQL